MVDATKMPSPKNACKFSTFGMACEIADEMNETRVSGAKVHYEAFDLDDYESVVLIMRGTTCIGYV